MLNSFSKHLKKFLIQKETNYSAYWLANNFHKTLDVVLGDTKEKMEGFEMGDDSLASFHYLGALLKEAKRHSHDYDKKPDFDNLKPLLIQFEYQISPVINGTLQREISFTWL